jgi:hypothetical protein
VAVAAAAAAAAAAAGAPDADASAADATFDIMGQCRGCERTKWLRLRLLDQFLLLDPIAAKSFHHLTIGVIKLNMFRDI